MLTIADIQRRVANGEKINLIAEIRGEAYQTAEGLVNRKPGVPISFAGRELDFTGASLKDVKQLVDYLAGNPHGSFNPAEVQVRQLTEANKLLQGDVKYYEGRFLEQKDRAEAAIRVNGQMAEELDQERQRVKKLEEMLVKAGVPEWLVPLL